MLKEQENKKLLLRKEELTEGFNRLILNHGGPVTFHNVEEVEIKPGKFKKFSKSKRVINISEKAIENRSIAEFIVLLKSIQNDLGADYFTF